ncbi:hypothetical protein ACNJUF_21195, partial [Mycobacterium tuberculosis]
PLSQNLSFVRMPWNVGFVARHGIPRPAARDQSWSFISAERTSDTVSSGRCAKCGLHIWWSTGLA